MKNENIEINEITAEGTEFHGMKAGQDFFFQIRDRIGKGINRVVFPEDAEISSGFVRGYFGIRDDNATMEFCSPDPEMNVKLSKWQNDFENAHGDKRIFDEKPKKKKKEQQ